MTVQTKTPFEDEVRATQDWFDSRRFDGITRLYSARQVVEQRVGAVPQPMIAEMVEKQLTPARV